MYTVPRKYVHLESGVFENVSVFFQIRDTLLYQVYQGDLAKVVVVVVIVAVLAIEKVKPNRLMIHGDFDGVRRLKT